MNNHGYSTRVLKMRKYNKNTEVGKESDIKNEAHPTKIPGLSVRQVVEQLKVNVEPSDKNTRRSSIPKLIPKSRTRTPSVDKGTYRISRRQQRASIDDTFEKIYVEAAVEIDKVDDKLNEIVTDIDDVDNQFEKVANAYENIELPILEKKQSKIPIKRFISEQVKTKLQNIDRRHSVHTNIVSDSFRKLSKKRISNIDTLDDLFVDVEIKTSKESTLQTEIENNVQNKANTNFEPLDDLYDDVIVTLIPKSESNEPSITLEDQNEPKDFIEAKTTAIIEEVPRNQRKRSIEIVNEDLPIDKKDNRESYVLEYKDDIPLTNAEELNKIYQRVFFTEETASDYDNVEIRPVSSKIALFEQRSNSNPKLNPPQSTEVEKPLEVLEVKVSKNEEPPNIDPIIIIDEPVIIKEQKTNQTQPAVENISQSIIEARNKVMENITIKAKNKDKEVVDTTKIKSKPDSPIKKSISANDIVIGGAMSYQKQRKYSRISSVEKLVNKIERNSKVCPIDFKEMPRRKSVSEKIALFEGKLSQPYNDEISNTMVESIKSKLLNHASNAEINKTNNEIDATERNDPYAAKIEELKSAKLRYGAMKDVKCIELNNGIKMPVIALGTALLDPELTFHVISAAIDLGYRAFDTAYIDGNEREIGAAIKYKIDSGSVKREDLFIINKLWSTFHRTDLVERACMNSLEAMQLDYFDLYLIHNPMSFKEGPNPIPKIASVLQYSSSDYLDAWFGMEGLVQEGLVRSIGVSNFNSVQLTRVVEKGKISPVVNQVESHPYLSQVRLQEFCSVYNVLLQSYGVLGSTNHVVVDSLVRICAAGMNAEPAQTLIRFQLDMDRAVVVKASTGQHLWSNLQSTEIQVNPADVRALHALNSNRRLFNYKGMDY